MIQQVILNLLILILRYKLQVRLYKDGRVLYSSR